MPIATQTPLQALRKKKGINLLELAEAAGISESHLSRIERGINTASPHVALRIVQFFGRGITRDQILFPEEYASRSKRLKKAS